MKIVCNKTDLLNKLIYENYIARPSKEMIKRVLGGRNPSGIYKVTNTTSTTTLFLKTYSYQKN